MKKKIEVECIFDEIFEPADFPIDELATRCQMLGIDGFYWLVIEEVVYDASTRSHYTAFLSEQDAWDYLKTIGIVKEEAEDYLVD